MIRCVVPKTVPVQPFRTTLFAQAGKRRSKLHALHTDLKCSSPRLAGDTACTWCLLWCVACDAHGLEALHTLAAGRSPSSRWGGIRAGSLHGRVPIKRHSLVTGKASWAALTLGALQLERWKALDVGTS